MNVCWVTRFPLIERDGKPYSAHAAVRLRMLIPAREMQASGHAASIVSAKRPSDVAIPAGCQVAVFDQLYPFGSERFDQAGAAMLDLVDRFQRAGVKTAADIHDDHFHLPGRLDYFRHLMQRVDLVIANTPGMKNVLARHTTRAIEVIGDPYEGPHGEPLFAPGARGKEPSGIWHRIFPLNNMRLDLAWFGHPSNLSALLDLMPRLVSIRKRLLVRMTVVTDGESEAAESCAIFNHYHGRRCRMAFLPWSLENTWTALQESDLCVIPVDVSNDIKSVKSANRLIETLRAGRFAIASPLPAYEEFSENAWIGEDIARGVEWALDHGAEVIERIRNGQRTIEQRYSPAAIAEQWARTMAGLTG